MIFPREHLPEGVNPSEPMQLALETVPAWIQNDQGERFRPLMCLVVGAESTFCYAMEMPEPTQAPFDTAADVLAKLLAALEPEERLRVQVRDPELATALRARGQLARVEFEVVEQLEAVRYLLSQALPAIAGPTLPSPLDQPGMSIERLAAFAEAGVAFYTAALWQHLFDTDVIEIHSPKPPSGMRLASVLGAGGETFGMGFHASWKSFDALLDARTALKGQRWSLIFFEPDQMPPEDAELWEEHGLRVAEDESAPLLLRYKNRGTDVDRPDAARLAFVEGLCRALAQTTEADLDAGRWEKQVSTFDGPAVYRLSLPGMLEEVPPMPTLEEPRQQALELCVMAREVAPRRSLQLLREALKLDPDCTQALIQLAERRPADDAGSEAMYRKAIAAARRALGDAPFSEPGYPFWLDVTTRPYMNAMAGLAETLTRQERLPEAADIYAEMLRLNPNDNQGIRYAYAPLLIELGRLDEARQLIEQTYANDTIVLWPLCLALISVKEGQPAAARTALREALGRNAQAVTLLADPGQVSNPVVDLEMPGDISEAAMVVDLLQPAWFADPTAVRWLVDELPALTAESRSSRTMKKARKSSKAKKPATRKRDEHE